MMGPAALAIVAVIGMQAAMAADPAPQQAVQPPESKPADVGAAEQVGVHLVQLPFLALDRHGRPVTDLRPEEIEVKQGRRTARVAYLERLRQEEPGAASRPGVRLEVEAPGGEGQPAAARASEYVLIFLDVQNDDKVRREEAEGALLEFLRGIRTSARIGVASFDGDFHLDLPYTTDRASVSTALSRAWARPGQPRLDLQAKVRGMVSKFEDCVIQGDQFRRVADERCLRDVAREYAEEVRPATMDYLKALEGVVRYAGGIDGPKMVLAVSHGVTVDPVPVVLEAMRSVIGNSEQLSQVQLYLGFGSTPEVERDRVLELAVRRRVSLHFVDRTMAPTGDSGASRSSAFMAGAAPLAASHVAAQEELKELAAATGGTFHASTRVLPGLQAAMDAREAAYELGYYVDEFLPRKKMEKISVETSRRGVRIVHRAGFYAVSEVTRQLNGRIVLGRVSREPVEAGNVVKMFQIAAHPRQIGYRTNDTEAQANFTLHVMLKDAKGEILADSYHFINHAYPRAVWEKGDYADVLVNGWFEAPPGQYELVAIFRNTDTEWEGQVSRSVKVDRSLPQPAGG